MYSLLFRSLLLEKGKLKKNQSSLNLTEQVVIPQCSISGVWVASPDHSILPHFANNFVILALPFVWSCNEYNKPLFLKFIPSTYFITFIINRFNKNAKRLFTPTWIRIRIFNSSLVSAEKKTWFFLCFQVFFFYREKIFLTLTRLFIFHLTLVVNKKNSPLRIENWLFFFVIAYLRITLYILFNG